MTAAETLRTAATLMRERAEGATPGLWSAEREPALGYVVTATGSWPAITGDEEGAHEDAEHIASWHPAVALAVADWLDAAVDRYDAVVDTFAPGSPVARSVAAANVDGWTEALAVANAYLNTTQEPT